MSKGEEEASERVQPRAVMVSWISTRMASVWYFGLKVKYHHILSNKDGTSR